jgi:hypothetical protein
MPSIVHYKSGYPSPAKPLNSSASFGNDGLVTVNASFLLSSPSSSILKIGQSLSPALFASLIDIRLQKNALFIAARSIEKRGGLTTVSLTALGAMNPPIFESSNEIGARSFSKSLNSESQRTMSFDYLAETISTTTVVFTDTFFVLKTPVPGVQQIYNRNGEGSILFFNDDQGNFDRGKDRLVAQPRDLTTTSNTFLVATLGRRTISKQFVYE